LEALSRYKILDTLPEQAFDRLTGLASRMFHTPIALISLIDEDRQWFKACLGLDMRETDRSLSFCAHAILQDEVMVVTDATHDPRFQTNPQVTGGPNIRFYAGAPLITPDGHKLGTLCVIDDVPRPWLDAEDRTNLADLAAMAMDEMELRLAKLTLENESLAKTQMLDHLRRATDEAQLLAAVTDLAEHDLDIPDLIRLAGELLAQVTDVQWLGLHVPVEKGSLNSAAWHGPGAPPVFVQLMNEPSAPASSTLGQGGSTIMSSVLRSGEALFVDHLSVEERRGLNPALVKAGVRRMAWIPLRTADGTRYVLTLAGFTEKGDWQPSDRQLLRATARVLNLALSRQEQVQHLEALVFVDSLTGLGNRRALERDVGERLQVGAALSLSLVDLGSLQHINEAQGYDRGDALLQLFGGALCSLEKPCVAYRLSGDEFALVMEGAALPQPALEAALTPVGAAGFQLSGVRVGTAHAPEDGTTLEALFEKAGQQLYRSDLPEALPPSPASLSAVPVQSPLAAEITLSAGPLTLHGGRVRAGNRAVKLTRQETTLLAVFMRCPEEMVSREALTHEVWGDMELPSSNPVEVHIFNLRRKLRELGTEAAVKTVRGQGYILQLTPEVGV